ncbi:putative defective protein IntQ [bioreactor metagenome]|uniref:Putative defective protein IntQ n=1 Tax=bioreactor metagenome TaxID=1076179 RepID=A0A645F097_9ZZZZ|nr:site-specific integrase [Christensenella sp.]
MKLLLDELRGAECYLAILTCAVMGCRRGEALGLYWSDIDFEANTIDFKRALIVNNLTNKVEPGELKTKNSRRILPMPDMLRAELLKVKQGKEQAARGAGKHVVSSPFVFTTIQNKPFRPDSISQAFKRAAVKVGLPDMRLHDLRHTAITYMLEAGENPKTVSEFAGHATANFTMNQYAHVLEPSKKKASDALMKSLFSK